jgi:hypothetical protein
MTTITTARAIFYAYPKLPVDAPMPEYVSLEDYEALATQADHNSDKVQELKDYVTALKRSNETLLALLRQWAEIGPEFNAYPTIKQLITATKAALDAQPGNNPGTSGSAD